MYSNNSYAQAGWSTLQSPYSTSNGQWGSHISTPASVYGALPTASIAPTPDVTTFQFTSFDPTILNCIVIGPRSQRYSVITASNVNTHTFFYDQNGRNFAAIEWAPFSSIEIYGIVPKQKISDWIKLSASQSQMSLEVFGKRYKWMPNGNTFSLFNFNAAVPELLALLSQERDSVSLEITSSAIQAGLLEVSFVVSVLLFSGRDLV